MSSFVEKKEEFLYTRPLFDYLSFLHENLQEFSSFNTVIAVKHILINLLLKWI